MAALGMVAKNNVGRKQIQNKMIAEAREQEKTLEVEETDDPFLYDMTDDMYVGEINEEMVQDFVCMLCYGIVFNPIKCLKCEVLVCKKCIGFGI